MDILNHHFMLEFVDSGLYFDENILIDPLLQVGSSSLYKTMVLILDGNSKNNVRSKVVN